MSGTKPRENRPPKRPEPRSANAGLPSVSAARDWRRLHAAGEFMSPRRRWCRSQRHPSSFRVLDSRLSRCDRLVSPATRRRARHGRQRRGSDRPRFSNHTCSDALTVNTAPQSRQMMATSARPEIPTVARCARASGRGTSRRSLRYPWPRITPLANRAPRSPPAPCSRRTRLTAVRR
jgi:hypothetical protein